MHGGMVGGPARGFEGVDLPPLRDKGGDRGIVTVKRTLKGILIQNSRKRDFLDEFREIITAEPERTGEPENWPPKKMKAMGY